MRVIVDADVIRYETGYAAETGWKAKTNSEDLPSWDYVETLLELRLEGIRRECGASSQTLYYTSGRTFRYDIAKTKPYKGTRIAKRPWHYDNLTVYMRDVLGAKEVTHIEADDAIAIDHLSSDEPTIIASRDKDLRMIPGLSYSWELGAQPRFGPAYITKEGSLILDRSKKQPKLKGTGLSFFYAQLLMGDPVDNIGGCSNCGPVKAYALLAEKTPEEQLNNVIEEYKKEYGDQWEQIMTENGQLLWICRKLNQDQSPKVYEIGMTE